MPYGQISVDSITTSDGYIVGGSGAHHVKNRIINGAMTIDQRNAGAAVTGVSSGVYPVDRWQVYSTTTGLSASTQRDTTAPTGFVNSLKFTTTTGAASGSTERAQIQQVIEGLNVADLGWGTSNAKTVTLSFWVRSSKTGQFGGSVQNYSSNRSYPFSYTINAANTCEKETITIPGDTTGTWVTDNSGGPCVNFNLGAGSSLLGSAGAWAGVNYRGATGDTSIVETTNATFFVTGVQLEAGSTATSYDYRHASVELQMCQRYFASTFSQGTAVLAANASNTNGLMGKGGTSAAAEPYVNWSLPVEMRTAPTCTTYNPYTGGTAGQFGNGAGSFGASSGARVVATSTRSVAVDNSGTTLTAGNQYSICISGTAEL
jgi:hypothetical protein